MATLLSIDPGNDLGFAIFRDEKLVEAGLLDGRSLVDLATRLAAIDGRRTPSCVVIELPQVYDRRHSKGDPNDLIGVAMIAGVAAGAFARRSTIIFVRPHAWKGDVPKKIHCERIVAKLAPEEKRALARPCATRSKLHNVIDAVGLGLWRLGR